MQDLKNRSLSFSLSVIVITVLLLLSKQLVFSILFMVALLLVVSVALWEFYKMAENKKVAPLYSLGITGAACYVIAVFLSLFFPQWQEAPKLILGALLFLFFFQNLIKAKEPLMSVAVSYLGLIYVVVTLTFLMKINFMFPVDAPISGQWWLMYLIVVTKSSDLGAYFVGKLLGKKPLAPKISPNKTLEGFFGGLLASLIVSFLLIFLTPHVYSQLSMPWLVAIALGLIFTVLGLFGDLGESLIKRDTGVKDSNKIKGSGGILDMVDSMIFTTPIFYLILAYGLIT